MIKMRRGRTTRDAIPSMLKERKGGREGRKEGRNGYVLTRFFLESRGVSIRSTSSQTSLQ